MIMPMTLLEAGTAADTYLLVDGGIMKLFRQGTSQEAPAQEVAAIRTAHSVGVKAPVIREMAEYEGRRGIVFERLQGPTMLQALVADPDRAEELGRQMAALHADLHSHYIDPVPAGLYQLHDALRYMVPRSNLAERIKAAVLNALDALPTGTVLCHGDLHPHNITLTSAGPVLLDWSDSFISCPAPDVAVSGLLLRHLAAGEEMHPSLTHAVEIVRTRFHDAYWQHYGELRPADFAQAASWTLPVMAMHLAVAPPGEKRQTLQAMVESLIAGK
jgi:tRNA A-37 threonylcarbamoyl transferase component Bud32